MHLASLEDEKNDGHILTRKDVVFPAIDFSISKDSRYLCRQIDNPIRYIWSDKKSNCIENNVVKSTTTLSGAISYCPGSFVGVIPDTDTIEFMVSVPYVPFNWWEGIDYKRKIPHGVFHMLPADRDHAPSHGDTHSATKCCWTP